VRRANVLVLYGLLNYPLRSSVEDHLYSFERFSGQRVFYVNLAVRSIPKRLLRTRFDVVVFHTSLLSSRWVMWLWRRVVSRALALPRGDEVRVAFPQDEFLRSKLVSEFAADADVDMIFSVAPETEWAKLYPDVDRERVSFHRVLTGYLDEDTLDRVAGLSRPLDDRPLELGYRAYPVPPWLGRHGMLKGTVAEQVRAAAVPRGLAVDISTLLSDTFYGDDWFRFLAQCRYQLGVEGGASVLDADGSIKERTEAFLAHNPEASFEQTEAACFPGHDGEIALFALSPRHLEACATRTCQVLLEGTYNGVLRPGMHYIELKRDLSNLEDVLDTVERDDLRGEIVERAYQDVVASGRYTYRSFVEEVMRLAVPQLAGRTSPSDDRNWRITRGLDRLSWRDVAVRVWALQFGSRVLGPAARRVRYRHRWR
jgi:hypothetical protein